MADNQADLDLQQLWQEVNQLLREGQVNRALWDAADVAVPIALVDDTLILGMEPRDFRHASYLQTDINRAKVRQILHARTGSNLNLRVIEGTTLADWERTQSREQEAEQRASGALREVVSYRGAQSVWEGASQELTQLFTNTKNRAYATSKARLMVKAFPILQQAEQAALAAESAQQEAHQRQLNRLIDRVATYVDMPPTALALEYLRYLASQKRGGAADTPVE
ncbi:MAG TPA: hypothetical protein VGM19_13365 [Armatimonadota bacterium]|jgi:hypothetical protein